MVVLDRLLNTISAISAVEISVLGGIVDAIRRIGPDHPQLRPAVGPQASHVGLFAAISAHQPMRPDLPRLSALRAPFPLQFSGLIDLCRRILKFGRSLP